MSRYLEEAAALVHKASDNAYTVRERLACARSLALLAAIDKGLLPQEIAGSVYDQFTKEPPA